MLRAQSRAELVSVSSHVDAGRATDGTSARSRPVLTSAGPTEPPWAAYQMADTIPCGNIPIMGDLEALRVLLDSSWAKAGKGARGAWRQTDRMTAEQVISFLADQRYCAIATTNPQGEPHLVPVSFLSLADGTLWLPTVDGSVRLRDVLSNSRAAVVVGQGVAGTHAAVMARGPVLAVASAEVPAAVLERAQAKLGDTAWAAWWLLLRPDRLLAYSRSSSHPE